MSQVAIVIDLPFVDAEQLQGQNVLRIAEDTARELRKSQPVDDQIRVAGVYVSETPLVVTTEADEVSVEEVHNEAVDGFEFVGTQEVTIEDPEEVEQSDGI